MSKPVVLGSTEKTTDTRYFRYCAGVAYEMKRRRRIPAGIEIRITEMELPLKKGVSSSAAVESLAGSDLSLFLYG